MSLSGLCGAMKNKPLLTIAMLGPPRIRWRGAVISIPRRQVRALLYRLAVTLEPVPRDVLATLFWPDQPTDIAHTNLSRLLYLLQRALPDGSLLHREEEHIALDPAQVWTDTHTLAQTMGKLRPSLVELRQTASLYRGTFLEGFSLPRAPEFDHWLTQERHTWERHYLRLLRLLVEEEAQRGHYEEAIRWAQRYLAVDELSEAMHRHLILLYTAIGNREAAIRQFERCVMILERELGVDPLPETRAAFDLARGSRATISDSVQYWRLSAHMDAPFVGRETTLEALYQAYMRARTGQTAIVFVVGEQGIGKTRLLKEFVASLPQDTLAFILNGSETTRDVPYAALSEAITAISENLRWEMFDLPPAVAKGLDLIMPALQRPLNPSSDDILPGHKQTYLWHLLSVLFDALCRHSPPLVLCVDDLSQLDESTRDWLTTWLTTHRPGPLVLVATYRPEEEEGVMPFIEALSRRYRPTEIALTGLSEGDVATLVRAFLGASIPDHVHKALYEFTGGNPLFLLEILHGIVEEQEEERITWNGAHLPRNVQDAVRRRLIRLSRLSYHVLEAAAVLGEDVTPDLLGETSGYNEEEIMDALKDLVARGLLVEENKHYRFAHQVVREVVYRDLLYGRRRLLHRRAARALQRLAPHYPARIAHHFHQGELWNEAIEHWLRAGDQARLLHAPTEAIRHYERALALQREQGDEEGAARTLMRLGLTHHLAFDFARACEAYDEGFTLWRQAQTSHSPLPPATQPLHVDWPHLETLDPALARDANSGGIIEHLFRGLAEWSPDMNVLPDLAREWDVLAQGHQYIFYLREDTVWSDGYPVTSQDIVTAWRRVLHPRSSSPFVRLLFPIRHAAAYHRGEIDDPDALGIRALDELTLLVELEHPCPFFPHLVAHPVTRPVPDHRLQRDGETWWHPDHLVTNGPFTLKSWRWEKEVRLERSDSYYGRWPGNVESVVLHLGMSKANKEAKWHMYEQDKLYVFTLRWGLSPEVMAQIRRRHATEFISLPDYFVRFLCFNVADSPFQDRNVRRAFALATNRHTVAALMGGDVIPAHGGLIPPGMPGHSRASDIDFDPLVAQGTLAAAGYPRGRGFPEIVFLTFDAMRPIGEYLQQAWQRILKVSVRLEVVPWKSYLARLDTGPRPDLFIVGWVADYPDPDSLLRVSRIREWTGWHHAHYARLLDKALLTHDQAERVALYQQADRILQEELPILPLVYSRWALLVKPWVRTFPVSPLKWWFWKDVMLDRL